MKLSNAVISYLKEKAAYPPARTIHPEDADVYNLGLLDGVAICAREIIERLKPEDPGKESE